MTPQPVSLEMIFEGTASASELAAFTIAAVFIIFLVVVPMLLAVWTEIGCKQPQSED